METLVSSAVVHDLLFSTSTLFVTRTLVIVELSLEIVDNVDQETNCQWNTWFLLESMQNDLCYFNCAKIMQLCASDINSLCVYMIVYILDIVYKVCVSVYMKQLKVQL